MADIVSFSRKQVSIDDHGRVVIDNPELKAALEQAIETKSTDAEGWSINIGTCVGN